jgi:type IV pilus assembly protein PilB
MGVHEILILNETVRNTILEKKSSHEIRKTCMETTGLVTLLEDGLVKAAKGDTSLQEVLRHLPRVSKPRPINQLKRLLGE